MGAIATGLMQVIDAGILFKNDGTAVGISLALAVVEFLWAIVSAFVLIQAKHRGARFVALCFVAYNVFGWILGAFIGAGETTPVPTWFVVVGGAFGMAYSIASAFLARSGARSQGAV